MVVRRLDEADVVQVDVGFGRGRRRVASRGGGCVGGFEGDGVVEEVCARVGAEGDGGLEEGGEVGFGVCHVFEFRGISAVDIHIYEYSYGVEEMGRTEGVMVGS